MQSTTTYSTSESPLLPWRLAASLRRLLQYNVLLALAGGSIGATTALLGGVPVKAPGVLVPFLLVLGVYNLDRLGDGPTVATPLRRSAVMNARSALKILVAATFAAALALSAAVNLEALLWSSLILVAGGVHGATKRVPGLKSFTVPLAWSAIVPMASALNGLAEPDVGFVGVVFCRILVNGWLGDLRDLSSDLASGVRTAATFLSWRGNVVAMVIAHSLMLVWLLAWPSRFSPLFGGALFGFAAFLASLVTRKHQELVLELCDFEFVLYPALLVVGGLHLA